MPIYSVVVPVYNSEKTLEELYDRVNKVFVGLQASYEIIFVEDCGRDQSWTVIESLKNKYPGVIKGIKLSKNFGQHNALLAGIREANFGFPSKCDCNLHLAFVRG